MDVGGDQELKFKTRLPLCLSPPSSIVGRWTVKGSCRARQGLHVDEVWQHLVDRDGRSKEMKCTCCWVRFSCLAVNGGTVVDVVNAGWWRRVWARMHRLVARSGRPGKAIACFMEGRRGVQCG